MNDINQPHPSLTAIVPTRDRPQLLRRALHAILGQDYPGQITALVVFDQSQPQDPAMLIDGYDQLPANRALRVTANTGRTPGLAGARNTGILAADTDLIAFCDDDDEWLPGKVTAQVAQIQRRQQENQPVGVVSCAMVVNFHGHDKPRPVAEKALDFNDFLHDRHNVAVHPCAVLAVRQAVLDHIGLVDENLPGSYAEDYEWLLRASRYASIPVVATPLVRIYWHGSSYFFNKWRMIADALTYLLQRYPEFDTQPTGLARIEGQIAFAQAAMGLRREARATARKALRHNKTERRAYLALLVSLGVVKADWIVALAHRTGRGI